MGSVVQFAAFFCIGSLFLSVATTSNWNENEKLNNKRSNPNSPGEGDFYFVEEKVNDNNVKSGRAVHPSAWSKEDKEPTLSFEKKTNSQFSDESSITKVLSYLLTVVQELKEDIFGIKEITILKDTNESPNPRKSSEDKVNQNKIGKNPDVSKPVDSTENTELRNKNQRPTPNYITGYYRNKGIEFTDDEEDDDLERFSDLSDDSSHKPDEETSIMEVRKNKKNERSFKCVKIKNEPDNCNFVAEKTTAIPTDQSKINDEDNVSKKSGHCSDCKESAEKSAKSEQKHSKASEEETENRTAAPPNSKRCKCLHKNEKNSDNNVNEKNKPSKKTSKSDEYRSDIKVRPQNEDSDQEEPKMSNKDKIVDNKSPGNNSKKKNGSEFNKEPAAQSTVLNSRVGIVTSNENKNEPNAFETTSSKQQEQLYTQKPGEKKQSQDNTKIFEYDDGINERTTVSFQSDELVLETPEHKMTTEAYTSDIEFDDTPKDKESKVIPTQIIKSNNENKPNLEIDGQKSSDSYYIGNTTTTTSENTMNMDKLNENLSKNLNDETGTNENEESEKLKPSKQDKSDSDIRKDDVTEHPKIEGVNDTKTKKPSENEGLFDSNKKNYHLDSTTASDLWSQNSNQEIQNHDNKDSDKSQNDQESLKKMTKRTEMEDSPDQEYEYEEDTEDFDIWDDDEEQDSDQIQEGELDTNTGDLVEADKIISGTVLTNESLTSQTTGYATEEKSVEQFDTFLEYFYKHSNNSFFQSLKNQSYRSSDEEN